VRFTPPAAGGLAATQNMNTAIGLADGLAVVQLEPALDGGVWLAARSECEEDQGALMHLTFDAEGELLAATDHSARGFGERDFNVVRALPSGAIVVSTLVPSLAIVGGATLSADAACDRAPAASGRTADTYLLSPELGARATRLGE
jgi:hypothetical protein